MAKKSDPKGRTRLNLKELQTLNQFAHEISGARLMIAQTNGPHTDEKGNTFDPCYVIAWVAPWQGTIKSYRLYDDLAKAEKRFAKASKMGPPVTPALTRDFQVSKVYQWEDQHIDKHSPSNLTIEQMERVVKKISDDFNMVAPGIDYEKPDPNEAATSYYYQHLHKILMRHKQLSFVIHEVAHAVDMQVNGNKWGHHGPSFVRTLIELAGKYQYWHDPKELEKAAKADGIMVAPKNAVPFLNQKPPKPDSPS